MSNLENNLKLIKDKYNKNPTNLSFRYKYDAYLVIGNCLMKCPTTRQWFRAFRYIRSNSESTIYVREEKDFLEKFILIEDN